MLVVDTKDNAALQDVILWLGLVVLAALGCCCCAYVSRRPRQPYVCESDEDTGVLLVVREKGDGLWNLM